MCALSPPGFSKNAIGNRVSHLPDKYTITSPCLMTQSEVFLCRPAELFASLIHRIHSLIAEASVCIGYPDRFQRILIPLFSELDNPQNMGYDSFSTCRCRIDGIADSMLIGAFQYEEV